MNRSRRTFLLVLLLALVATALMAGGGQQAATPAPTPEAIDLGGRTIKLASYYDFTGYFKDGNGRGKLEAIGAQYNCTFEFVTIAWGTGPQDIITSVAAGAPVGDILIVTNRWIYQLASNGAIRAMDDILDDAYYASLPDPHNRMKELYSTFGGKAYGLSINGFFDRNSDMQGAQGWAYNRDMIKAAGLETPGDLQKRNAWTWDTMREYAKVLTKDTDGDGQIDVWGVTGRLDPWPVEQEMAVYSNGGGLFVKDGGRYVFGLNRPEALAAFQLWRDMVNVDKSVLVGDAANTRGEFINGKAAMLRLDLYALPNDSTQYTFDYGYVFFPKGPNGGYVNPVWGMDVALLPVTEKNPKAIVEVVNGLFDVTSAYRDLTEYKTDILGFFMPTVKDRDSLTVIEQMLNSIRLWDAIPSGSGRPSMARSYARSKLYSAPRPGPGPISSAR